MTLVLTRISPLGISMAADSAVTLTDIHDRKRVSYDAIKLQTLPYLKAGISCWGEGFVDSTPTDEWLKNFIGTHSDITSLENFANELADDLNHYGPRPNRWHGTLGFHLAGFVKIRNIPWPCLYHIHDGPSQVLSDRGEKINPRRFNANQDVRPIDARDLYRKNEYSITRNGDYDIYVNIFDGIESFFEDLYQTENIFMPEVNTIKQQTDYNIFQIRTISQIYKFSNMQPSIGGNIRHISITREEIYSGIETN